MNANQIYEHFHLKTIKDILSLIMYLFFNCLTIDKKSALVVQQYFQKKVVLWVFFIFIVNSYQQLFIKSDNIVTQTSTTFIKCWNNNKNEYFAKYEYKYLKICSFVILEQEHIQLLTQNYYWILKHFQYLLDYYFSYNIQKIISKRYTTMQNNDYKIETNNNSIKSQAQNLNLINPYISMIWKHMRPAKIMMDCTKIQAEYQREFNNKSQNLIYQREDPSKKKLFLDLDETVIHSEISDYKYQCSIVIQVANKKINLHIRPYCIQFLTQMAKYFDIIIYTASHIRYAKIIVDHLNKLTSNSIKHVLCSKFCIQLPKSQIYFKDLRIFRNLDLASCIIIDNTFSCFYPIMDNGIPIKSYFNDPNDIQLQFLAELLIEAASKQNFVQFITKKFNIKKCFEIAAKQELEQCKENIQEVKKM